MSEDEPTQEDPPVGRIWTCTDRSCGKTNAAVSTTCWGCGKDR